MNTSKTEGLLIFIAIIICTVCISMCGEGPRKAAAQEPPAATFALIHPPDHPHIKGRYSVSWQEVGGEVKEPFSLMILKDAADGRCFLIDGTLADTQVNFGPQVPCE